MNPPPSAARLRLAVLISGGGTTLANLIEKIAQGEFRAEIALVISSNPAARGLEFARRENIEHAVIERNAFDDEGAFGTAVFDRCRRARAEYVIMAGFLKHIPIPQDFENRVLNIHPALIPAFCGKGFFGQRVHEEVLRYGAKISGCTVHFVDQQYDHGPIILQRVVPVAEDDTPASLAARVFEAECTAYPEAIQLLADGRVSVEGRQVRVK